MPGGLAAQVAAERTRLGEQGWRGQSIPFAAANRAGLIDGMAVSQAGEISRGRGLRRRRTGIGWPSSRTCSN
jgi:hypothetical protein